MRKDTIRKKLLILNKELKKWYDGQEWKEQKQFLSSKLIQLELLDEDDIIKYWSCFNKICDYMYNFNCDNTGQREYLESLVYWRHGHHKTCWP